MTRPVVLLALAGCVIVFILRTPTLLEPAWHTDEGSFAAVAEGLLHGHPLYSGAWESKPPLFLYLYAGIFKVFGTGVVQLKLAATVSALGTQLLLFLIGRRLMSERRAALASIAFGVMLAAPFWAGNLALSEVFSMPPMAAGVLLAVWQSERRDGRSDGWMALAGVLFGLSFLIRQPAALALAAVAVWLLLVDRASLRRMLALGLGFLAPILSITAAFALFGSFYWFWNANVSYFFFYVPTGNRLTSSLMPLLVLPLAVALLLLAYLKCQRRPIPAWSLPALWFSLAFIGALLNGKDYSHYLLQTFPPLVLLVVSLWPPGLRALAKPRLGPALVVAATFAVSWFLLVNTVFSDPFGRHWTKGINYYGHVYHYVTGSESRERFNIFFDKRVNTTEPLDRELGRLDARGKSAYIWGEYPWVYALAGLEPVSRYVTSYYLLENDKRGPELMQRLQNDPPAFVIVSADAEPRPDRSPTKERYTRMFGMLQSFLAARYEQVAVAGRATVFALKTDTPEEPGAIAP